jgi:hypothetical protein
MNDKLPEGFVSVNKKIPAVSPKKNGRKAPLPPASLSDLCEILLEDGSQVKGFYQVYNQDINAHHLQVKQGDTVWFDLDGNALEGVIAWSLVKE